MAFPLAKLNPHIRDQSLRVITAGVAGPALILAGWKYPGTVRSKAVLAGLGLLLIGANYSLFRQALESQDEKEEDPLESLLGALAL